MSDRPTWDKYFMRLAVDVASRSKDPSTKIGAVIVGPDNEIRSTGYNGFPRGVNDTEERLTNRPTKYICTVHAEANAIFNAVRSGISVRGCTLYVAGLPPCHECAKAIIQSGIRRVVTQSGTVPERWKESIVWGALLMCEGKVLVEEV